MFDCARQGLKTYQLVLFNNIFVQYFQVCLVLSFLIFQTETNSEAYSEPCQTPNMEIFA